MTRGQVITRFTVRAVLIACLVVALSQLGAHVYAAPFDAPLGPKIPNRPKVIKNKPRQAQEQRVVLSDVPSNVVPQNSNIWQCACDNDGCWPGCFTVASASILQYWAARGFPQLWDGNENATLQRLRDLFPNLFCYNNVDDDGQPSDSGYDAFDVAKGFDLFVQERGYKFTLTPIPQPTFDQIAAEIDAGRPIIGAFGVSPWGSHAGTIIGYDNTGGRQLMIVRPNLLNKADTELTWGEGYGEFGIVTVVPNAGEAAVAPKRDFEVVVDDAEATFTTTGEWRIKNVGYGDLSRAATTTDPSNLGPTDDTAVATWTPALPFDGLWEAYVWMPREDTDNTAAMIATYRITHAEGLSLIRRSQNKAKPGWMSLGAYPFARGNKGSVQLGNLTGDNPLRDVYADAIKFVWRAPLVVQSEEGGPEVLISNGQRYAVPDKQTFDALRLNPAWVRKVPALALTQYPDGGMLPSVMSSWIGQYFGNAELAAPASAIQPDTTLNFRWNGAAPAASMDAGEFSVRWTRYFALTDGEYPFRIEAVGGVRMWVDGKLEINAWDAPANILVAHEKAVPVTSGLHRVDVEFAARGSYAQISFGNLPPNVPIVAMDAPLRWTSAPTMTLRWADTGDPDNVGEDKPRRFFVTLWNEQNTWRATSGWISEKEWTPALPVDGQYFWSVLASDGTVNSDATSPQPILIDRTAPWAQMLEATGSISAALALTASTPIDAYRLITDANGNLIVDNVAATEATPAQAGATQAQLVARSPEAAKAASLGNLPAIYLRWWAKDEPRPTNDGLTFDVQVRETIRAQTSYTIAVQNSEVTRVAYELTLSGTEEITTPVVITEIVPITTVVPLQEFAPIADAQWITFATGLAVTETVFIGNPGSTYEFRVRGVDAAGNAQEWYDGYSIPAQIDPKTILYREFLPTVHQQ
jgi:hypothetical protein